jgi:hypothetical protein
LFFEGIYFNVNLILVLVSVVLTVVVLNFHYRGPKKSRVPRWCRRLIMNKVGHWLGFHFNSPEFSSYPSSSSIKSISQRENSNSDINRNPNDTEIKLSVVRTISTNTNDDNNEDLTYSTRQKHLLTHNIEQILLKMQTQFNPSKINDENLKLSILREILECQRLILTIHAKKQNVHPPVLYDIYEEWKILAIIVDRICFIFYLISMLAASIIFFVREPILKRNG